MIASIWLVLHFLRGDKSDKPAPVYHRIWTEDGLPVDPLIVQAVRSI